MIRKVRNSPRSYPVQRSVSKKEEIVQNLGKTLNTENVKEKVTKTRPPKIKSNTHNLDEKQLKLKRFLERVGKRIQNDSLNLMPNATLYKYNVPERYRCYDEIGYNSGLVFEKIMKEEHLKIAHEFQNLLPHWKYIKIKSSMDSNHISAMASLNISELGRVQVEEEKQMFHEKFQNLCTSLFLLTVEKLDNTKEVVFNKLKGEDYLEEDFLLWGNQMKFGPFAYLPTNISGTSKMFSTLRKYNVVSESDVIIDFDCNAGLYGLALAKISEHKAAKKIIGFENAPVLIRNFLMNAKTLGIPAEPYHGCNLQSLGKVLQEFHYKTDSAVLVLHPKGTNIVPNNMIEAIKNSTGIKRIIFFVSDPERQAYFNMIDLLKPPNKKAAMWNKHFTNHFKLSQTYTFDLHPNTPYLECVFVLDRVKGSSGNVSSQGKNLKNHKSVPVDPNLKVGRKPIIKPKLTIK